jgi:hypothetical protein
MNKHIKLKMFLIAGLETANLEIVALREEVMSLDAF